jgi:hypothetical protein
MDCFSSSNEQLLINTHLEFGRMLIACELSWEEVCSLPRTVDPNGAEHFLSEHILHRQKLTTQDYEGLGKT